MRVILIYDPDKESSDDAYIILDEIKDKMEDDYPEITSFDIEADN